MGLLIDIVVRHPEGGIGYTNMIDNGQGELVAKIFREAKTAE
jgi:hypothetical protein